MTRLTRLATALAALAAVSAPACGQAAGGDSLAHRQVAIEGTVDASAAYAGGTIFVTTTFGKTIAIDAASGNIRWTYTPPNYSDWAGSYRITNSTPVVDPSGRFVYAAAPDGQVRELDASSGRELWSTAITRLPAREKIASPLTYFHGRIIAVTGGYIGDAPPYQGHVAILDASNGHLISVWNSLCSDRSGLIEP
ncbi:MAG TPA: PQQ-binding-like beta-propeller repeat protein, partial [Gemmatimonadales bacterium]|nr:PQQ-binding-like beta-propeller repeat protein [Gemmatimonadales bacterium]